MRLARAGLYGQINFVLACTGSSRKDKKGVLLQEVVPLRRQLQHFSHHNHNHVSLLLLLQGFRRNSAFCVLNHINKVGREIIPVLVALTWEFDIDVYFKIQTNHSTLVILILFFKKLKLSTTVHTH